MINRRARIIVITAVFAGILAVGPAVTAEPAGPAIAVAENQSSGDAFADSKRRIEEATRSLLGALELMLTAIPQYEAPEILDNGDIIIRRIQPDAAPKPDPDTSDETDETRT